MLQRRIQRVVHAVPRGARLASTNVGSVELPEGLKAHRRAPVAISFNGISITDLQAPSSPSVSNRILNEIPGPARVRLEQDPLLAPQIKTQSPIPLAQFQTNKPSANSLLDAAGNAATNIPLHSRLQKSRPPRLAPTSRSTTAEGDALYMSYRPGQVRQPPVRAGFPPTETSDVPSRSSPRRGSPSSRGRGASARGKGRSLRNASNREGSDFKTEQLEDMAGASLKSWLKNFSSTQRKSLASPSKSVRTPLQATAPRARDISVLLTNATAEPIPDALRLTNRPTPTTDIRSWTAQLRTDSPRLWRRRRAALISLGLTPKRSFKPIARSSIQDAPELVANSPEPVDGATQSTNSDTPSVTPSTPIASSLDPIASSVFSPSSNQSSPRPTVHNLSSLKGYGHYRSKVIGGDYKSLTLPNVKDASHPSLTIARAALVENSSWDLEDKARTYHVVRALEGVGKLNTGSVSNASG